MFTKFLYIAAAGVLAITPAAISIAQPQAAAATTARAVQLEGPFLGFTQTQDRIQLRLKPASTMEDRQSRRRIIIRDTDGHSMAIDLKHGQTWASAELPATLIGAAELHISVN
jgi:hypothetical protein